MTTRRRSTFADLENAAQRLAAADKKLSEKARAAEQAAARENHARMYGDGGAMTDASSSTFVADLAHAAAAARRKEAAREHAELEGPAKAREAFSEWIDAALGASAHDTTNNNL